MNNTKLKKEKLELDYKINKIDNILDCEENLNRYIETIENSKLDTPPNLNSKILEKLDILKSEQKNTNECDKENIKFKKEENKEQKIYENVSEKNKENDKLIIRLKYKFVDIVKIVACTVFALMIWEITPMDTTYAKKTNINETKQQQVENRNKIDIQRKVNDFFMSPIKIERRDK